MNPHFHPNFPNAIAKLALAALLLVAACAPVPTAEPTTPAPRTLETRIADAGLAGARVGYLVSDLDSGAVVATTAADQPFIPASTLKVVTALAALETLGPGHRFQTAIHAQGHLTKDGALEGDIWLKGGGDPLLAVQDLLALAQQLRDGGLTEVRGHFFFDESSVVASPSVDAAQPDWASYNAPVSALSLDFNRVDLHWRPTDQGGTVLSLTPALGSPPPGASRTTQPPGEPFARVADGTGTAWRADIGQLPDAVGSEALPVPEPARRTAVVFRALAAGIGLTLPVPKAGIAPAGTRPVAALLSAPLVDTLRPALRYSNNLVSELVGRAASHRLAGHALDRDASAEAVMKWLKGRVGGIAWDGARLLNHSGLSTENRITPRQMNAVMTAALKARYGGWGFAALLPSGGWDHALAGMFAEPRFSGRVWAKSGTMRYTKGMTGLMFAEDGRRLAFALYVTDFGRRRAYDVNPARYLSANEAAARAWIERAERFMEELVGDWIAAR